MCVCCVFRGLSRLRACVLEAAHGGLAVGFFGVAKKRFFGLKKFGLRTRDFAMVGWMVDVGDVCVVCVSVCVYTFGGGGKLTRNWVFVGANAR